MNASPRRKRLYPVCAHHFNIRSRQDAAFGNDNALRRNARQQIEPRRQACLEVTQVALVDADEPSEPSKTRILQTLQKTTVCDR